MELRNAGVVPVPTKLLWLKEAQVVQGAEMLKYTRRNAVARLYDVGFYEMGMFHHFKMQAKTLSNRERLIYNYITTASRLLSHFG